MPDATDQAVRPNRPSRSSTRRSTGMRESRAWHFGCSERPQIEAQITSAEEAAVRVLIVEHEDELRMILAEEFRRRGVEVFEATNVILIDLTLPEFGGTAGETDARVQHGIVADQLRRARSSATSGSQDRYRSYRA